MIIVRDMKLEAQAQAIAFECALPNAFDRSDGIGRLSRASSGGLAMKREWKTIAALGPDPIHAAATEGEFSFIGCGSGRDAEMDHGGIQSEGRNFDAVDPLVKAVDGGSERTVGGF